MLRRVRAAILLNRKRVGIVVLVATTLLLAATARLFVWPNTDDPRHAQAVVVLAGGDGERLHEARVLMARGVAPTLAISAGHELDTHEADGLCSSPQPFEVVCFVPTPADTRGEARAFTALARQRHWNNVVVVTSTYHVTRARMLIERCYDGHFVVVGAAPPANPLHRAVAIAHEWVGMLKATLARRC